MLTLFKQWGRSELSLINKVKKKSTGATAEVREIQYKWLQIHGSAITVSFRITAQSAAPSDSSTTIGRRATDFKHMLSCTYFQSDLTPL